MKPDVALLVPLVVLVAWSLVMWLWMYATRLPAILRAGMKMDPYAPAGEQMAQLPAPVRWKADNYNHLMEQPTLFYALVLSLALMGQGGSLAENMAWCYAVLRIAHSLVQAISNKVELRFTLFVLSNIPLFALTGLAVTALLEP